MSTTVYIKFFQQSDDNTLPSDQQNEIKRLMKQAEYGDEELRVEVAEYFNGQLAADVHPYFFAYWNYGENQRFDDFDDLVEYTKLYAQLLTATDLGKVIVSADYRDKLWMFEDKKMFVVRDEDQVDNREWFESLQHKSTIAEAEKAKQELDDLDDVDGPTAGMRDE